jgi:hypothetical protein
MLGSKGVVRTKDAYSGRVENPAVEDLLRKTLIRVAKEDLGWDIGEIAKAHPDRSIVDLFKNEVGDFTKYRLAKAFLHWTQNHRASDLSESERGQWKKLLGTINWTLK